MHVLVLTGTPDGGKTLLPALEFLDHTLTAAPLDADPSHVGAGVDVVLVDATADLGRAAQACRVVAANDTLAPVVVVIGDGGLAALKGTWGFDDWILPGAQPAEVETRLRLAAERSAPSATGRSAIGHLVIDEETYVVRLRGTPLDLTYREFELLKFLAGNPGRVYTRGQLLQEVWGYDYFGGTRTVDVHIRRLRAKLGAEYESLIGTVRSVGYKLDPHGASPPSSESAEEAGDGSGGAADPAAGTD